VTDSDSRGNLKIINNALPFRMSTYNPAHSPENAEASPKQSDLRAGEEEVEGTHDSENDRVLIVRLN